MAKKIFTLPWTMQELKTFTDGIVSAFSGGFLAWLTRVKEKPFALVYDERDKNKKFFHTEEEAQAYFEARDNDAITPEIEAYRFIKETVPGEEQYKMTFNVKNIDDSDTYGKTAKLRFDFATADTLNGNRPTEEPIEIFFTFTSAAGTKTDTKRFNYSEGVTEFDITEYLEPDANDIIMLVRGLTSGLTITAKATWTAVYLPFDSNFDITADRKHGENFGIPYSISGVGTKEIEFLLDNGMYLNDTVYEGTANKTYNFRNSLTAGLHTLQMKAYTTVGNKRFESDMLYFEFIVNGEGLDITTTIIKCRFPSGTPYFMDRTPGLIGEQYVDYLLAWAYFSTSQPNAVVQWKTKLNGVETIVGSRQIDEMEGTVGIMPDPVKFQPDTVGTYDLYAFIKGNEDVHIGEYTINVIENTAGLREAENPTMKLRARGRSNNEPSDTINDWSNNGFKATFNDKMTFDGLAGYTGDAVRFDNGATAIIDCKPFATENGIIANGGSIAFHFKTFNVEDEDAKVIWVGDENAPSTAFLGIYGKRLVFRPSNGAAMEYPFASEELTHIAIVVQPKTGVTDKQMMFFIINGIEAPGKQYGDTAVFNIGTYADKADTNGMIFVGNPDAKAGIEVNGITVYPYALSMWQGMNNFMIDFGGDVAQMMKKNNIFQNADFNRPIISKIKEQYRVLEIIGNLGLLETSNKKVNFYGSCIYTDPFNPKFNFERKDGGAYIETAGQSRLEDLMAKSFHLDLNENDTVATYQDGKLTHKNRIIFAENNIHENGVRIDMCGADSSMTRNASHMKMVNKHYPYILVDGEYVLRTPPQRYALSGQWSRDMAEAFDPVTKDAGKFPWQQNINFAPASVPIVVVWHEKEDDPIQVYGMAQMTEEKKASYANGNHSIYIKAPLADGSFDPFDRFPGTKGERGWNNDGLIEIEYVNPSDLTNNVSLAGFDDETTRDYSFESCFPKKKDMLDGGVAMWNTFKTEYLQPITATNGNQEVFDAVVENILYLPSFAMYYNKVMDNKMNDSLCRNMHVIRYNMGTEQSPKWLWWAKWWDADVSKGLFQSNALGVDPETDRQTKDANGNYVMAGHDMWIWNALEKNAKFQEWCKKLAVASYAAGWSATTEKAEVDKVIGTYSEALYNLDGLLKFLNAFRKGNDYMIRMQGSSIAYIHGFIEASYAVREAQMAIGSYASRSISFTATSATYPSEVRLEATTKWRFGLGTTSTNIVTGIEKTAEDGIFAIQLPQGTELGRDFLSVYGADKLRYVDISDFARYFSRQINLGNLIQVQRLFIGYATHDGISKGINQDTSISFTGIVAMTRLTELSIIGLMALEEFDISSLSHLTKYFASATAIKNFRPADGTKFTEVELPDTLQTIECRNIQLGLLSFWQYKDNALTEMQSCPTSLLSISLIGMGEDDGTHNLVHLWCQMLGSNPHLIQTAQITYRAINWQGIPKEDLFILAKIPKAQRNLTGYVFCDAIYTDTERQLLSQAFGSNVFDPDAQSLTLVCDGKGDGLAITAVGETLVMSEGTATMEQGNTAQLTAAGFPISGSSAKNYRWGAWINGENSILSTNDDYPEVMLDEFTTINRITGVLTTTEGTQPACDYDIRCMDIETGVAGSIAVRIIPRSYPESVSIEYKGGSAGTSVVSGKLQITSLGHYIFKSEHLPKVFTGRMKLEDGGVWTIVDAVDNVTSHQEAGADPFVDFCLQVDRLNGEQQIKLHYESNWRNGSHLTAEDVVIAIIAIIEQALGSAEGVGNPALFEAVQDLGITPSSPSYFSSADLKLINGVFDLSNCMMADFRSVSIQTSTRYIVTSFMKNVTGLNLTGCTALTQQGLDEAVDAMSWLRSVSLEGTPRYITALPPNLTDMALGSPTVINTGKAGQMHSSRVSVQSADNVETVVSLGLADNDTYKWLQNVMTGFEDEVLNKADNEPLFLALEAHGVEHSAIDTITFTEIADARIGYFHPENVSSLRNGNGRSVLFAMPNCCNLNLSASPDLDVAEISGMSNLRWLITTGTSADVVGDNSNINLASLTLGTPARIVLYGTPFKTASVHDNVNIEEVTLRGKSNFYFNLLTNIFYNVLY